MDLHAWHTCCTLSFNKLANFGLGVAEKPRSSYQEIEQTDTISLSWLIQHAGWMVQREHPSRLWHGIHLFFNLINSETNTNHADTSRNLLG